MQLKNNPMKTQFLLLFLITSVIAFSQSNVYFDQKDMVYPQKAGIYETLEDFLKDSVKYVGEYNEAYNKIKLVLAVVDCLDLLLIGFHFLSE